MGHRGAARTAGAPEEADGVWQKSVCEAWRTWYRALWNPTHDPYLTMR
jgi:hypothetical protein